MNMSPILARFLREPPFISDGAAISLLAPIDISLAEHPKLAELRKQMEVKPEVGEDGIAVFPVEGVMARKPSVFELFFGFTDTAQLTESFAAMVADPAVKGIVLSIDSPGGFVTGGPEFADAIAGCEKPTVSWSGGMMCSLAYWAGSQATQVVASRSAIIGSIGAYTTVVDATRFWENMGVSVEVIKNKEGKFKAAGITSLTEDQRDQMKEQIQKCYDQFKNAVLAKRPGIPSDAMRGQVFDGEEAKKQCLVDMVGSLERAKSLCRELVQESPNKGK